jgi:hypothetical protein
LYALFSDLTGRSIVGCELLCGTCFCRSSTSKFPRGKATEISDWADGVGQGREDEVTVSPYDAGPATHGISIGYCNLFDENNTGRYGPYLHKSDTAAQYNEGQIDPRGRGWDKNLREQFERRKKQGFAYIELILPSSSTSDKKIQPDHQEIDGVPRSYRNRIRRATNRSRCQGLANVVAPDRLLDCARGGASTVPISTAGVLRMRVIRQRGSSDGERLDMAGVYKVSHAKI